MLEDMLYDMLPIFGLAVILSAVFVLSVLWRAKGNLRIFVMFAVSDIINGVAFILCGVYGIFVTRTGAGYELFHPSSCLYHAPHLLLWAYSDTMEMLCLLLFLVDRTLQIIAPIRYGQISKAYLSLKFGLIFFGAGLMGLVPNFYDTIIAKSIVVVPKMCRFEQVVLPLFYDLRLFIMQWLPVLGMIWTMLIFVAFLIRQSKPRWSYNWSELSVDTKQMIALAFIRCLFCTAAVRMILINVKLTNNATEIVTIRDLLLRAAVTVLVCVPSPAIYVLLSTRFAERVRSTFNGYATNTERQWQSANDPPLDRQSEPAESWQWQSMTGPRQEPPAHLTMEERAEMERSASFYCDSPPASDSKRPFPNTHTHGNQR